jgi:hypothetical protein
MAQRYLVKTGMAYPTNDVVAAQLAAATQLSDADRQELVAHLIANGEFRVADVGEIVDDIRPESADWLLEQGHIEPYDRISDAEWQDLGRPEGE